MRPERTGVVLGALSLLGGCQTIAFTQEAAGLVVGFVAAGALLGVGVTSRRFVAVGLGVAGLLLFAFQVIGEWFGDTLPGALALLVLGLGLVGIAVATTRTRVAR